MAASTLVLAGCGSLDELTTDVGPAEWCRARPCVDVGGVVVDEPWSAGLVLLLAALWVAAGLYFLVTNRYQRSRRWLGVALLLGGDGALLAGVSYQAFGYELKCAGRDVCLLTNGYEIGYNVAQTLSVSAMLVAVAYACTTGRTRRGLFWYAAVNSAVYVAVTVIGVLLPSAALLSFEVLLLFALPVVVVVVLVADRRARAADDPAARSLVVAALLLVVVQVAYFAAYAGGLTAALWRDGQGVYFSENDVLHVGMVLWLGYVVLVVGRRLRDVEPAEPVLATPLSD